MITTTTALLAITVAILNTVSVLFIYWARKEILAAKLQRDAYKAIAQGALEELRGAKDLLVAMVEEMGVDPVRDRDVKAKGRN